MLNRNKRLRISGVPFMALIGAFLPFCAEALGYRAGDVDFRLTGYGIAGLIEPDFDKPLFLGDFKIRAQAQYEPVAEHRFGMVYSIDATEINEKHWAHEAFGFWQWRNIGRIEAGITESVAHKLSLGLPDVGGLNINEHSLLYKKMGADGPVISSTVLTTGHEALRLNLVSASTQSVQYGVSVSGITGDYDAGFGAGIKLKHSEGKTKFAVSLGGDLMNNLDGYTADMNSVPVFADWRAQVSAGMNIQYNSFVFGLNGRAIYDKNPIGIVSDGISGGIGASYDLLNYSLSLSYILSDTGIWHDETPEYVDNSVIGSFRCKYSKFVDIWTSVGVTRHEPFLAAAIRLTF